MPPPAFLNLLLLSVQLRRTAAFNPFCLPLSTVDPNARPSFDPPPILLFFRSTPTHRRLQSLCVPLPAIDPNAIDRPRPLSGRLRSVVGLLVMELCRGGTKSSKTSCVSCVDVVDLCCGLNDFKLDLSWNGADEGERWSFDICDNYEQWRLKIRVAERWSMKGDEYHATNREDQWNFNKINVFHNSDVVDFELVVNVDSELYVVLGPLGSLVLVGTLVDLIHLQVLHDTDIGYVPHSHVHVHACKN
uniref:Uncharacterized protein n=1 Tax=Cucumis melo TaxID=3656 RepID=A0A9I9EM62_CUCME